MKMGGKQTTATITDECPGCPFGGLDLTRGLFEFFAPLGAGVISGEWWFADDAPEPPKPKPEPPKPKTTHKPPPPPPTSTHHTSTHTTTSYKPTSSSSSERASSSSSASASANGVLPTGVSTDDQLQHLLDINKALIGMGGLIAAGAQAN